MSLYPIGVKTCAAKSNPDEVANLTQYQQPKDRIMKTRNIAAIIAVLVLVVIAVRWACSANREMKQLNKETCILYWERQAQMRKLVSEEMKILDRCEEELEEIVGTEINNIVTIDDEYRPATVKSDFRRYQRSAEPSKEALNEIDHNLKVSVHQILFTLELVRGVQLGKAGCQDYNEWLKSVMSQRVTKANEEATRIFDELMNPHIQTAREIIDLTWDKIPADRKKMHEDNYEVANRW